jgi:hypothetical protein
MGIYVDNWKIRVDICGYLWIFVDIAFSLIYMLVGLYDRVENFVSSNDAKASRMDPPDVF